jgi:hypothetical protein
MDSEFHTYPHLRLSKYAYTCSRLYECEWVYVCVCVCEVYCWIQLLSHVAHMYTHTVRINPPPLSVRSPSSGFGLTCLRWDSFGYGWILWWLKRPIPCLVRASPSGYSPFPFTNGYLHFLRVLELLTRLGCWVHGTRINSSCDCGF